ncbi:MAG: hypothetical protein OEM92_04115 [Gammaproteobacteria bacterium]|nr:hypothetical protein [Gammaproteobacteria bacterium]MDH3363915.1 hypothetical protein [Gammaproteobacteria bacterium]
MKIRTLSLVSSLFALLFAPIAAVADMHDEDDGDEIEFDEAHVFFELNNTDGDLGIHALIDGEPWKRLRIEDQQERRILDITLRDRLRRQGLTELFFESAEPSFDELSPEEFFERFPAGTYEIEGVTLEGDELESETEITHAMPAPPEPKVNGMDFDEDCEEGDPVAVSAPVVIAWDPVDSTHPDLGSPRSGAITVLNYEVVVEVEIDDDFASVLSVTLPPAVTSMTIPAEFIAQGDEFKYEVLAREESFNQTATESCFVLE